MKQVASRYLTRNLNKQTNKKTPNNYSMIGINTSVIFMKHGRFILTRKVVLFNLAEIQKRTTLAH